jgi:carboxymethylenebutenolidase
MGEIPELSGLRRFPLARRGMMTGGLITGLTVLTTRVDAQAIHTDEQGLEAGEVSIPVEGGQIPGYAARPAGAGTVPVIVVNEEVFGVHDYIGDVCRRLAKAGYYAIAPEIYARLGDISKLRDFQEMDARFISKTPDRQVMSDLDSAVAFAAAHQGDQNRLGVIGFCRGGRNTWLYDAHNPRLKAAVSFYGAIQSPTSAIQPQSLLDVAAEIHAPMLTLNGRKDGASKVDYLEAVAAKARAAGKVVEVVLYDDAGHGFHADYRPSYVQADAIDGWNRAMAWFKKYGVA